MNKDAVGMFSTCNITKI